MPDVFKILKDLEMKSVGLDPTTNKMQEGYFVSFRSVGLPIAKQDFENPWSPLGSNLEKDVAVEPAADPATAPKTGSGTLDPKTILLSKIGKDQQSFLNTFLLTDDKLRMSNTYAVMPSSSKLSDSWWAIITGANGIPTDSQISESLKAAYDAARAKLMDANENPTPQYAAYTEREEQYHEKVKAWNRAYAAAFQDPLKLQNWPTEGVLYQEDAEAAMDRWVSFGHKEEIENAIATLAAQGTDPAIALIGRAKKRFQNSLHEFPSIPPIPYTIMLPNTWYDPENDEGWYEYSAEDFHTESNYESSSTAYGGGGGFDVGFWSVGGSFNETETRQQSHIQTNNLVVEFKYASVDIKRPWLDASLLNLKNWFLMGNYDKGCISDGTMGQELPTGSPKEPTFLPSVVTTMILIRDLSIRWDNWQSDWSQYAQETSGSGSVGWGPFCVAGSYRHGEEKRAVEANHEGESLKVPGTQLLGYVSMIDPLSPGVNSSDYLEKQKK